MTGQDRRFEARLFALEKAKNASVPGRALIELRKRIAHFQYLRTPSSSGPLALPVSPQLLFVTIAFNVPAVIAVQLEALKRFVTEDFRVVVVDNSTDSEARLQIAEICRRFGAAYVLAPVNPFSWKNPSVSHAFALDWTCRWVLAEVNPEIVVFLDHDLFPVAPVSIRDALGPLTVRGHRKGESAPWFLWPGLLMMRYRDVAGSRISFMPRGATDTGGSLWWTLYSKLSPAKVGNFALEIIEFAPNRVPRWEGEVHLMGEVWLHLVDVSGWGDGVSKLEKIPALGDEPSIDFFVEFLRVRAHEIG
jgi:hypothetical protein